MSDYLSVVQTQFHEWMDYLGVPATTSAPIYAIAGLAGVAVAAHLFLNSIPGESELQMISNIDYTKVSLPTTDGKISALCLDGNYQGFEFNALFRPDQNVVRICLSHPFISNLLIPWYHADKKKDAPIYLLIKKI